jgi:hypothetical protein
MDEKLIEVLGKAGKETAIFQTAEGSQVLVLPRGGRMLGLFAPGDSRNFLWTNPALENANTAAAFLASDAWQNSGGDRTWLAPEIDFFLPNYPDLTTYHQPRALDPGNYQMEKTADSIRLTMDLNLTPLRHGRPVALRLTKSVYSAANPLHQERDLPEQTGLQYAGYSLRTTLELVDLTDGPPLIGLWSLLQMPHGGEMLMPSYGTAAPEIFFGDISSDDLRVEPGAVLFQTRATGAQKLGLRAISSPGRIGYHYRKGGVWQLIVRSFTVNPADEYIDVPWTKPEDVGYAVQACNVNTPDFGHFSEMEYHAPAIGGATGRSVSEDTSHVWAFRGSFAQMSSISEKLLGIRL